LQAYRSGIMNIYRKFFNAGKVKIRLNKTGANLRGMPLVLFIGPDTSGASPLSCGGKEKIISKPGSPFFEKCTYIL